MNKKEAREHIYEKIANCLDTDLGDREGWVLGGVDDLEERRFLRKVGREIVEQFLKKGKATQTLRQSHINVPIISIHELHEKEKNS